MLNYNFNLVVAVALKNVILNIFLKRVMKTIQLTFVFKLEMLYDPPHFLKPLFWS